MPDDYIKRSDVVNVAMEWCPDDDGSVGKIEDLREMLDELESIPAADVEPVKHGRWIYKNRHRIRYERVTGVDDLGIEHTITVCVDVNGDEPYCSECNAAAAESFMDYCPRCGAKMDKEEKR